MTAPAVMFCCLVSDSATAPLPAGVLERIARTCSPRVERHGQAVVFDATGSSRVIGPPETIAREVMQLALAERLAVRVAIAPTTTTAWLVAQARPGANVVASGASADALADLPLRWLATLADLDRVPSRARQTPAQNHLATFDAWGLRTMGDIAALDRADVHARMGPSGVRLHQAACGEDATPFVPMSPAAQFVERLELEWPIDGLEPLAFVLARQCERLSAALERADRGAVTLSTRLRLVTKETHERVLHLPAPIRDARVLRTLVLLDLESHPPPAAIDIVELHLGVTPGRIVQGALLAPSVPAPEDVATLTARLGALMGEARVGSPVLLDTYDARAIAITGFRIAHRAATEPRTDGPLPESGPMLRRFRLPMAARVTVERGMPVRVVPSARGLSAGLVVERSGPLRTSGQWWTFDRTAWDRDEWDLALADGGVYRVARDRQTGTWEIEGVFD